MFDRSHRRTEANLIRAREILKKEGAEREAANIFFEEAANIYLDEAMKTRPQETWDALLTEILKGDSKRIWHGDLMENLTEEERRLILPMMKTILRSIHRRGTLRKRRRVC